MTIYLLSCTLRPFRNLPKKKKYLLEGEQILSFLEYTPPVSGDQNITDSVPPQLAVYWSPLNGHFSFSYAFLPLFRSLRGPARDHTVSKT